MPRIKQKHEIADVQQLEDGFPKKEINKVGIRNVQVPIQILKKDNNSNYTSAEVSIYTNLTAKVKGANMSRYRILIEEHLINKKLNLREYVRELLIATQKSLDATDAYIKIKFDYFLIKEAPVSKVKSHINYKCCIESKSKNNKNNIYLTVEVPYTSLCPCSKKISDYGAHNQRSYAKVKVEIKENEMCWIEDIIDVVENTASSPIINALKRVDEAYQTERMYENPMFVEDMVRVIAEKLDKKFLDKTIIDYVVVVNHQESIHLHDACAILSAGRNLS